MEKIQTKIIKRKYIALFLFIFSLLICYFVMNTLKKEDAILNNYHHELIKKNDSFDNFDEFYKSNYSNFQYISNGEDNLQTTYALTIGLLSLIMIIYMSINTTSKKKLWIILYIIYFWLLITKGEGDNTWIYNDELKNDGFMKFLFLFPYLLSIYKESIKGVEIDLRNDIIRKGNYHLSDEIKKLEQLRNTNIISEEQFIEKVNSSKEGNAFSEFKLTEEYNILVDLKNKGLFTEEEVEKKIKKIIHDKIKNDS